MNAIGQAIWGIRAFGHITSRPWEALLASMRTDARGRATASRRRAPGSTGLGSGSKKPPMGSAKAQSSPPSSTPAPRLQAWAVRQAPALAGTLSSLWPRETKRITAFSSPRYAIRKPIWSTRLHVV